MKVIEGVVARLIASLSGAADHGEERTQKFAAAHTASVAESRLRAGGGARLVGIASHHHVLRTETLELLDRRLHEQVVASLPQFNVRELRSIGAHVRDHVAD